MMCLSRGLYDNPIIYEDGQDDISCRVKLTADGLSIAATNANGVEFGCVLTTEDLEDIVTNLKKMGAR